MFSVSVMLFGPDESVILCARSTLYWPMRAPAERRRASEIATHPLLAKITHACLCPVCLEPYDVCNKITLNINDQDSQFYKLD